MKKNILFLFLIALAFSACSPYKRMDHNFTYFQTGLDSIKKLQLAEPVIKPNDQLSIQVFSTTVNQEQAAIFNIPNGTASGGGSSSSSMGFLVNENGDIYYPYIGKVHVAYLTILQLKDTLKLKLSPFVKEPEVLIRFLNFKVTVLGGVGSPGTKTFSNQRVTVLDAIAAAGDLSDFGRRDNILVLREEKGETKNYTLDIRSATIFNSPAYQLQQNDIVYVHPNDNKLKTVKRNPNVDRDLSITATVLSLVLLAFSVYNIFK